MLKVINGYKNGWLGVDKLYIGRPNNKLNLKGSILANPFIIGKDGTREEVVEKYRVWLNKEVRKKSKVYDLLVNYARLHESEDIFFLTCYCSPQSCHGDIIIRAVEYILKTLNNNEL